MNASNTRENLYLQNCECEKIISWMLLKFDGYAAYGVNEAHTCDCDAWIVRMWMTMGARRSLETKKETMKQTRQTGTYVQLKLWMGGFWGACRAHVEAHKPSVQFISLNYLLFYFYYSDRQAIAFCRSSLPIQMDVCDTLETLLVFAVNRRSSLITRGDGGRSEHMHCARVQLWIALLSSRYTEAIILAALRESQFLTKFVIICS